SENVRRSALRTAGTVSDLHHLDAATRSAAKGDDVRRAADSHQSSSASALIACWRGHSVNAPIWLEASEHGRSADGVQQLSVCVRRHTQQRRCKRNAAARTEPDSWIAISNRKTIAIVSQG